MNVNEEGPGKPELPGPIVLRQDATRTLLQTWQSATDPNIGPGVADYFALDHTPA